MIVVIEGGDKAGKYTQAGLLQQALKKRNIKTTVFEFPNYDTPSGKIIKQYLKGDLEMSPVSAYQLFEDNMYADIDKVKQALKDYGIVIMNRYYYSNIVYAMANGLTREWCDEHPSRMPKPDMVILLDITYEESCRRQGANRDRYEKNAEYFKKVCDIYRDEICNEGWHNYTWKNTAGETHEHILTDVLQVRAILSEKPKVCDNCGVDPPVGYFWIQEDEGYVWFCDSEMCYKALTD